jgi:hypothetical protein
VGRRASLNAALSGGKFAMHLMYFTEQPMSAYDAKAGLDFGATALMFSNKHFDPNEGSRIYNEYLEHYTCRCPFEKTLFLPVRNVTPARRTHPRETAL